MLNHQVIGFSAAKNLGKVFQPLIAEISVHRIHYRDFLIEYHIRIIRHTVGNRVLSLEKVDFAVVYTHISDVFRNIHNLVLLKFSRGFSQPGRYSPRKRINTAGLLLFLFRMANLYIKYYTTNRPHCQERKYSLIRSARIKYCRRQVMAARTILPKKRLYGPPKGDPP